MEMIFQDENGRHISASVFVRYRSLFGSYERWFKCNWKGEVYIQAPTFYRVDDIFARSPMPGFWLFGTKSLRDSATYALKRLPTVSEPAWWLECLGINARKQARGTGIKIGVVDTDIRMGKEIAHIAVKNAPLRNGFQAAVSSDRSSFGHGEAICRILSDRSREAIFLTAAPSAQITFIDATSDRGTIDSGLAAAAILKLGV